MFRLRITLKKNVDTSTVFILPDSQRNYSGPAQTLHRTPYDSCRTFVLAARWRRTTCFNPRLWNHRWETVSHMYCLKPTKSEENTKFSIFSYLHKLLPWCYSPSKYWGATWSVVLPVNCRAFPSTQNFMCTGHVCMKSWNSVLVAVLNNLAKLHLFHACNVLSFKDSYHCVGEKFPLYGAHCFSSVSLQDQRTRRWVKYFPFYLSFYI